jgi:hypothetical protein
MVCGLVYGPHSPLVPLLELIVLTQAAFGAEVAVVTLELGVGVPVGVPVEVPVEVPVGEDAELCVAEHPATAKMTALVIAAAIVAPGRDRLVMGGCLSLAPRTLTTRYVTVQWSCPICSGAHRRRPCRWALTWHRD